MAHRALGRTAPTHNLPTLLQTWRASMAGKATSLKVGDSVSVLTQVWGEGYAKKMHGTSAVDWKTGKT